MVDINIPTPWVIGGYLPGVCCRHGAPATRKLAIAVGSRIPLWVSALIPTMIIFLIVIQHYRKVIPAAAWPFCDECRSRRRRILAIGCAIGALAPLLLLTAGAIDPSYHGPALIPTILSITAAITSAAILSRSGWAYMARAVLAPDGWNVTVTAHETFAAQIHTAMAHAGAQTVRQGGRGGLGNRPDSPAGVLSQP